jgi:hypothetical protein
MRANPEVATAALIVSPQVNADFRHPRGDARRGRAPERTRRGARKACLSPGSGSGGGDRNACSFLLGAARRAAKALGYTRLVTGCGGSVAAWHHRVHLRISKVDEFGNEARGRGQRADLVSHFGGVAWTRPRRSKTMRHGRPTRATPAAGQAVRQARPLGAGYRRLWAASTLSGLGDGVRLVALPLLGDI